MSVVNGDLLDEGLQSVMGKDRCQNEWKPSKKPMVDSINTKYGDEAKMAKNVNIPSGDSVDASWAPVKEPNWMDNLKSCVKSVALFGGLSFLIFYWKEAGLMASSVAVPSMCICTALAGWGCGKNVSKSK